MATELEVAWAAGLWEGEGCFSLSRVRNRVQPQAVISSVDEDVIVKFHKIVEFGAVRVREPIEGRSAKQVAYVWSTSSIGNFKRLVLMFWPYLGERRRARALEVMDLVDQNVDTRTTENRSPLYDGRALTP